MTDNEERDALIEALWDIRRQLSADVVVNPDGPNPAAALGICESTLARLGGGDLSDPGPSTGARPMNAWDDLEEFVETGGYHGDGSHVKELRERSAMYERALRAIAKTGGPNGAIASSALTRSMWDDAEDRVDRDAVFDGPDDLADGDES